MLFCLPMSIAIFGVNTSLGAPHRYILFPGSELVSCDTVKSFAAQAKIGKSFAARHGKLKSKESSFLAERAKNNQLCVTCQFKIFIVKLTQVAKNHLSFATAFFSYF
jgi:hypothetical protein